MTLLDHYGWSQTRDKRNGTENGIAEESWGAGFVGDVFRGDAQLVEHVAGVGVAAGGVPQCQEPVVGKGGDETPTTAEENE